LDKIIWDLLLLLGDFILFKEDKVCYDKTKYTIPNTTKEKSDLEIFVTVKILWFLSKK